MTETPASRSREHGLDLDLDLPARIEEAGEDRRVRRADVAEDLGMRAGKAVEVVGVCQIDTRSHDVLEARACAFERRADELEAHTGLVVDVLRRRRAVGGVRSGAGHV